MTLKTEDDASAAGYELQAFRQLVANPAWEEIAGRLARAVTEHSDGCKARNKTPAERAEHIEAAHLAEELAGFPAKRIKELQESLQRYAKRSEEAL